MGGRKMEKEKERLLKRQEAKWLFPLEGWHKANFDRASKGNPSYLGCGGIIRNEFGDEVAAFSLLLGFQTNHFLKASAACHVVKLAFEVGVTNLWLVGDSNNIIKSLNGKYHYSLSIANLINETHVTLAKFERVHVTHVFWEANPVADWFANNGVQFDQKMTWQPGKSFSMNVKSLIELDKIQGSTKEIKLLL